MSAGRAARVLAREVVVPRAAARRASLTAARRPHRARGRDSASDGDDGRDDGDEGSLMNSDEERAYKARAGGRMLRAAGS